MDAVVGHEHTDHVKIGDRREPGADPGGRIWFEEPVRALAAGPSLTLRARLARLRGLSVDEQEVFHQAGCEALVDSLLVKLNRVFLLELNAMRLVRRDDGAEDSTVWAEFLDLAGRPEYLEQIGPRYPGLQGRINAVARLSAEAVIVLARRAVADREELSTLLGGPAGNIRGLTLGLGDPHHGGRTVAQVDFEAGPVMYKPRPLTVDAALGALVDEIFEHVPGAPHPDERIRVPKVLLRERHGWAEYIEHRYCADATELASFYRGLGHWLAVLQLVGGTDMHAENLIAQGPVPVVVDAESLFTADTPAPPTGRGEAVDLAGAAIRRTVLRTGLLPLRAGGYVLAGVDISAAGSVPGQQPLVPMPVIVGGGTPAARMDLELTKLPTSRNHPSPHPLLHEYWGVILDGYRELSGVLRTVDSSTGVRKLLDAFEGCEVRRILRDTQAYVDIGRMLWHPASLHDEDAALNRARDVLLRNAQAMPGAPDELAEIDAEIADLRVGDIPCFTRHVDAAAIDRSVETWRTADFPLEEMIIQGALVGAYLNERSFPPRVRVPTVDPHSRDFEARRRALTADLVQQVAETAVRGEDRTATWISPVLTPVGWAIRPSTADLYAGQGGVAVALAEYLAESRAGRATPVSGLQDLLDDAISVLRDTEELVPTRTVGAFTGVASQVWTWCALSDLLGHDWLLDRARTRAKVLESELSPAEDLELDLLSGAAGVVVPLLNLAGLTGEERWLEVAATAGRRLDETAQRSAGQAWWTTAQNPEGIGGFAHGAAGIGWALARLALSQAGTSAERKSWAQTADQAFAFQESLYRSAAHNWADVRIGSAVDFLTAWCHGSTGVGLAALDLRARGAGQILPRTDSPLGADALLDISRRAARAGTDEGFGWSHTLCHGDLGLWELLDVEQGLDPDYHGLDRAGIDAEVLSGLEERGAVGGLAREAFSPGLMSGLSGVIHVLLRMHPEHSLLSPLLLESPRERRLGRGAKRSDVS